MKKCKLCKKILKRQKYFCSKKCMFNYNKKYNLGFWNSKLQKKFGKLGIQKCKKNNLGRFDSKQQSVLGKRAAESNRINKKGAFFDEKIRMLAVKSKNRTINSAKTRKRYKLGCCYNPTINLKCRINQIENRKKAYFNGIKFDSISEMQFAMNIHYQIEKLVLNKNYQFKVDNNFIDFFIKKHKCFIEYHPNKCWYSKEINYFNERRKILDKNGYKDYKLLVIK